AEINILAESGEGGGIAAGGLLLARSDEQRVWHPPSAGERQRQGGELHHELSRRASIEIEGIPAPERTLVRWIGKEAREGGGFDLRRHDEYDDISPGAHRGPLGDLGFQLQDLSRDNKTGDTLDDEAMVKRGLDVGAEHDPPLLAIDHESAPAPPVAPRHDSPFVDGEAHRAALLVEEAGVDSHDNGIRRDDLLHGAPQRRASRGDQTDLRPLET